MLEETRETMSAGPEELVLRFDDIGISDVGPRAWVAGMRHSEWGDVSAAADQGLAGSGPENSDAVGETAVQSRVEIVLGAGPRLERRDHGGPLPRRRVCAATRVRSQGPTNPRPGHSTRRGSRRPGRRGGSGDGSSSTLALGVVEKGFRTARLGETETGSGDRRFQDGDPAGRSTRSGSRTSPGWEARMPPSER